MAIEMRDLYNNNDNSNWLYILNWIYSLRGTAVPSEVMERCRVANELCELAGGELRSRQVIASIIAEYDRENH